MNGLRRLLRSRPWLAALVLAAALTLRLLIPAGFMPTVVDGTVRLTLCPGAAPASAAAAMPRMKHHGESGPAPGACAYADLALPALGTAEPALAAAALAFAFVLALLHAIPAPARAAERLRPPLRGPPLPV